MTAKIFVAIAVSQPEVLTPLPGALSAARRMAAWAAACGYQVVHIDDTNDRPVTTDRLREEVTAAIDAANQTTGVDRVVIFYAGHGCAKGVGQNFWLLSEWDSDPTQAVNVVAMKRMLRYYGIKQVSIMADACSEIGKTFGDVQGHPIFRKRNENPVAPELDHFLAANFGEAGFMITPERSPDNRDEDAEAFCLFTEVLLDGLEGETRNAFDELAADRTCVTSQSLAKYLQAELPDRASRFHVTMEPELVPGFFTDRIYAEFEGDAAGASSGHVAAQARVTQSHVYGISGTAGPSAARRVAAENAKSELNASRREARETIAESVIAMGAALVPDAVQSVVAVSGADIRDVFSTARASLGASPGQIEIVFPEPEGRFADLVIELGNGTSIYVCALAGFATAVAIHKTGNVSITYSPMWARTYGGMDEEKDVLAALNSGTLGITETADIAAIARNEKHANPVMGCIASYLYDSIGDVANIQRVANYYARRDELIPLDVALLSEAPIRRADDGSLVMDIPPVPRTEPRSPAEAARLFTYTAMDAAEGARIAGRVPWLNAGWEAIETALLSAGASEWAAQAQSVRPYVTSAPFTALKESGLEPVLELLQIAMAEPG